MIWNFILNFILAFFDAIFSFIPSIDKLPPIGGYDIDTALVNGMADINLIFYTAWYLYYMFLGFLAILFYHGVVKQLLRFLLGHRAPH